MNPSILYQKRHAEDCSNLLGEFLIEDGQWLLFKIKLKEALRALAAIQTRNRRKLQGNIRQKRQRLINKRTEAAVRNLPDISLGLENKIEAITA